MGAEVATYEFAAGQVRIELPRGLRADERDESARGLAADVEVAGVAEQLKLNGFEVVADLDVQASAGHGVGAREIRPAVTVDVAVGPDQASVVLTSRDGVWSWHHPHARSGEEAAVETLTVRSLPGTALVLRFAAPRIAGLAIGFLERDVDEGLVHLGAADRDAWTRIGSLEELDLSANSRILLLVHGTFSSTTGGYAQFGETEGPGREFLTEALRTYDAVIGYDHRTLSVDPRANAEDLFRRLCRPAPAGARIDIIGHSRGGLVARALVELVLPDREWAGTIERIVFVGVPNSGTNLAEPERWSKFVDLYTNILIPTSPAGPILGAGLKRLGVLVKYLAAYAVTDGGAPGLAAMEPPPRGEFVTGINRTQVGDPAPVPPWFTVTSNFHVDGSPASAAASGLPRAVVLWLAEGVVDDLLDGANDLVVDTASMTAINESPGMFVRDSFDLGENSVVHHLNYFRQPDIAAALHSWLIERSDDWRGPQAAMLPGGLEPDFDIQAIDGPRDAILIEDPGHAGGLPPLEQSVEAHVRAEMASKITVSIPIDVRLLLSRNPIEASPDTITATDAPFDMAAHEVLTVELKTKRNLSVNNGKTTDLIALPAGSGISEVTFEVVPIAAGPIALNILLRRQSGQIVANLKLSGEARDPEDPDRRRRLIVAQVATAAESSAVLDDSTWLEIWQEDLGDHILFHYELRQPAPEPALSFTSPKLHNHEEFVADLFAAIERQWVENSDRPAAFRRFLQSRGSDLFERLFDAEMQAKLWELRDDLSSILLLADEPYFPWELVHLKPPTGPRQAEPRFLAQYGLLRWQFVPFPANPRLHARAGRVFSLCPRQLDGDKILVEAIAEAEFLKDKLGATDLRATNRAVERLLRSGNFDVLHFSGHGLADTEDVADAKIMLDNRTVGGDVVHQFLSATTVAETAELTAAGPLVVINACQTGRGGVQLSSMGGFAAAFLAAGAQAFVACLWSVRKQPSRIFTESLYEQLLAGVPLGQAVSQSRAAARSDEDAASWLSYVVYGRPDATLVLE